MTRLAQGDVRALAPLYERHRGLVMTVLRQQERGRGGDAEDLCHEVFLALSDMAGRFRKGSSVRALLVGIAMKKSQKSRLGQWLRSTLLKREADLSEPSKDPRAQLDAAREAEALLAQLPEEWRTVVVLNLVEGWTGEEIAEALGVSPSTVATRIWRARQRIRELGGGTP